MAVRNGCEPEARIEALDEDIERWSWSCPVGADVVLVAYDGGHVWPPSWELDASEVIWEFFEQHPMPE